MIDPVQTPTAAAPSASTPDTPAQTSATNVGVIAGAQKTAAPSNSAASAQTAQSAGANGSNGSSESQSASDAPQPLRLLIEHDKATNQYVYKLYDSSGRIVREIPQETLAEAQKQAAGALGSVIDTKV